MPIRPKPVTSVIACTPSTPATTSAARRLSVVMERMASATHAGSAFPCFKAVVMTPVPMALVRMRSSPCRAAAFVSTRSGSIRPVTA